MGKILKKLHSETHEVEVANMRIRSENEFLKMFDFLSQILTRDIICRICFLNHHCTLMIISIIDWLDTHQIKPTSNYYNGHLDTKNHENVMNCTYYIVFEQNYKNIPWWKSKKERMKNKTEEQTKVNI